LSETLGTTSNVGTTTTSTIPDVRTDIFRCTNKDSQAKRGKKSNYSGCKKKIFELSGQICVAETQTGGICEGDEEIGDGFESAVTNQLEQ